MWVGWVLGGAVFVLENFYNHYRNDNYIFMVIAIWFVVCVIYISARWLPMKCNQHFDANSSKDCFLFEVRFLTVVLLISCDWYTNEVEKKKKNLWKVSVCICIICGKDINIEKKMELLGEKKKKSESESNYKHHYFIYLFFILKWQASIFLDFGLKLFLFHLFAEIKKKHETKLSLFILLFVYLYLVWYSQNSYKMGHFQVLDNQMKKSDKQMNVTVTFIGWGSTSLICDLSDYRYSQTT